MSKHHATTLKVARDRSRGRRKAAVVVAGLVALGVLATLGARQTEEEEEAFLTYPLTLWKASGRRATRQTQDRRRAIPSSCTLRTVVKKGDAETVVGGRLRDGVRGASVVVVEQEVSARRRRTSARNRRSEGGRARNRGGSERAEAREERKTRTRQKMREAVERGSAEEQEEEAEARRRRAKKLKNKKKKRRRRSGGGKRRRGARGRTSRGRRRDGRRVSASLFASGVVPLPFGVFVCKDGSL